MSDKLKPGMLTYDEPHKSTIFINGHKIGEGTVKRVPIGHNEETRDYTKPGEWSPSPMSISGTVKMSKKEARLFRRQYMKKARLPRKLKKAYRHMVLYNKDTIVDTSSLKSVNITIELGYWIGTQNNYPHTKWVRKAYCQVYKTYKRFNELLVKEMLSESLPHRSPEMVITKEQQGVLQQMIKSSIH